jgi:hypothetical protein
MKQNYSIFIATDELFTCPVIQKYARLFDTSLQIGKQSLVSFTVPVDEKVSKLENTHVHYNENLLDVKHATIFPNANTTSTLTLTLLPRDIGVTNITVTSSEMTAKASLSRFYTPHLINRTSLSADTIQITP